MAGPHDKRAVDVRVHGDVQGVGYRFGALRKADELDLAGWVRNEPDGDVTAHLEGIGHRVDSMLEWMRAGTKWSHVSRVDVEDVESRGLEGFELG